MTLPRLKGFADYWKDTPPVNEIVAAVFSGSEEGNKTPAEPYNPEELLSLFPRAQ